MARTTLHDSPFTGTNGDSANILSPTVGAALTNVLGEWKVQDNRVYGGNTFTTTHVYSTSDLPSVSDGLITMTTKYVAAPGTGTAGAACFLRRTNGANFIRLEITPTSLEIYEFTGGGAVSRSVCTYAITWAVGDTHDFGLEMEGTDARLFWDGVEVASGTVSWTDPAQPAAHLYSSASDFTSTNGFHFDRMLVQTLDVVASGAVSSLLGGGLLT